MPLGLQILEVSGVWLLPMVWQWCCEAWVKEMLCLHPFCSVPSRSLGCARFDFVVDVFLDSTNVPLSGGRFSF
jgi:hypothetical protein